ncbi:hypothetical protein [Ensifer aridi]|uniref:hypothetical protein n=1 Tax=Ensifer aridi TaxID=1708715 RepID=UPI000A10BD1F|nr:hypothetical protein [Ensifer aridi]
MTLGIPTFDSLAHAAAAAPEGYALYHKTKAREYIKARNDFIAFVAKTVARRDMTAEMKIAVIAMHPGKGLY